MGDMMLEVNPRHAICRMFVCEGETMPRDRKNQADLRERMAEGLRELQDRINGMEAIEIARRSQEWLGRRVRVAGMGLVAPDTLSSPPKTQQGSTRITGKGRVIATGGGATCQGVYRAPPLSTGGHPGPLTQHGKSAARVSPVSNDAQRQECTMERILMARTTLIRMCTTLPLCP